MRNYLSRSLLQFSNVAQSFGFLESFVGSPFLDEAKSCGCYGHDQNSDECCYEATKPRRISLFFCEATFLLFEFQTVRFGLTCAQKSAKSRACAYSSGFRRAQPSLGFVQFDFVQKPSASAHPEIGFLFQRLVRLLGLRSL